MSSVLDRKALEDSPLADLHLLARELGVDGYRRLRKADLVGAIIARQGGGEDGGAAPAAEVEQQDSSSATVAEPAAPEPAAPEAAAAAEAESGEAEDGEDAGRRSRRGRRGGRSRSRTRDEDVTGTESPPASVGTETGEASVEGTVELAANGSAFLRLALPESTDEDVYISAAQVKRCELVSGDRVSGPVRPPRQSERYPSLVRVDTINGRPADEVAEGSRFEDRPVSFPVDRLALGAEDVTVRAIEWLTPFGRGSRVTITGPARAGKTEALRRVASALAAQGDVELIVALAGVRPEEVPEWSGNGLPDPAVAVPLGASAEAQAQAVEQAVEQGRRVAARGGDAVVVIDSVAQLPVPAARRALATARNLVDGGSVTILATAPEPIGGETTVVALDGTLTALGRFPALELTSSGTMRPELLVGQEGAEAIARARAEALA